MSIFRIPLLGVFAALAIVMPANAALTMPNQVNAHITKTTGSRVTGMGSDHFQVCPRNAGDDYRTWFAAHVKAPQAKVFMDIKIWVQAYKTNAITGANSWADIKDNHRRTPDLAKGQKNTSRIALSLDTTSYTLQGQAVRQKFRIRWKKDRPGPDKVLYGYDGYTDSCNLPLEGGTYGGLPIGEG